MARFLAEPSHEYGIAFVRLSHQELEDLDLYMEECIAKTMQSSNTDGSRVLKLSRGQ
jgi:hypothetical protein